MGSNINVNKLQFEISQSVTASGENKFSTGDAVEVSFLTRGSSGNGAFASQKVDLFYATDKDSPSWQRFSKDFPKTFFSPNVNNNGYVSKSFVTGLELDIEALKMVITGSVNSTGSYTIPLTEDGTYPPVRLKYDNLSIKVHTPKTEITDEGVLVWNSPAKYIKADKDGIEIKGGDFEAENIITDTLQVYGDITAFGQMTTTNLEPFTGTIRDISTTSSPGTPAETKYAKGDHVHDLPFSTLNTVAGEGQFTKISGSSVSTGSFGRIETSGNMNVGGEIFQGNTRVVAQNITQSLIAENVTTQSILTENATTQSILVENANTSSILVRNSVTGSFLLRNALTGSFIKNTESSSFIKNAQTASKFVFGSVTQSILVENATTQSILVENSTTQSILVENATTQSILVENATTQSILVENSNTASILVRNSQTSSMGDIGAQSGSFTYISASGDISGGASGSFRNLVAERLHAEAITDALAATIVGQIDNDEIPIAKLASDSVEVIAGDGLKTGGLVALGSSVTLNVDVGDFAGTGLKDEGSEDLGIDFGDSTFQQHITGSSTSLSSSLSTRVTTLEELDVDDDLTIAGDSGDNETIDMDSETLTLAGGTGIKTVMTTNTVTTNVDFQDTNFSNPISGSLGINANQIRSLTSSSISGSWRGAFSGSVPLVSGSSVSTGSFGNLVVAGVLSASDTLSASKLSVENDIRVGNNIRLSKEQGRIQFVDENTYIQGGATAIAIEADDFLTLTTDSRTLIVGGNVRIAPDLGTNLSYAQNNAPEMLTLEGNISASGNLKINTTGSFGQYGGDKIHIHADGSNSHIVAQGNPLLLRTEREADTITLKPNNIDLLHLDAANNGRVGINETTPLQKLHIDGIGDERIQIDTSQNTGETSLDLVNTTDSKGWRIVHAGSDNKLKISHASSLSSGVINSPSIALGIDTIGQVGIGSDSPSSKLDVHGTITARDKVSSPTFVSGFAGSGFRIETGSISGTSFTIDDLTVRGTMSVFELLIHQIRATNGSIFVSNTGKILSSSLDDADNNKYSLFFDTGSGYGHSFIPGDLIRAQRFNPSTNGSGSTVFKSDFHIISVNGTTSSIAVLTGSDAPQPGYEYVRIGHIHPESASRQGSIYLTADDDNAPFIDVVDGITSHSHWNATGYTKTRLGKLDGIGTTTFGSLSGYGFYASGSAFLEGSINATQGKIGGFSIDSSSISSSNGALKLFDDGGISGSQVHFTGGDIGGFTISDTAISSSNNKFVANSDGTVVATDISSSGFIQALSGRIGGSFGWLIETQTIRTEGGVGKIELFAGDINGNTISRISIGSGSFNSGSTPFFVNAQGSMSLGESLTFSNNNLTISGTISASQGNIGGFTINSQSLSTTGVEINDSTEPIFISSSNFKVDHDGNITASNVSMSGNISSTNGSFNGTITANNGTIGGFTLGANKLSSTNLILSSSTTLNDIVISASNFTVTAGGKVIASNITASDIQASNGTIGGWTINNDNLQRGLSADLILGTNGGNNYGIFLDDNSENENFWFINEDNQKVTFQMGGSNGINYTTDGNVKIGTGVEVSGSLKAQTGTIGGFELGSSLISASNGTLIFNNSGQITASAVSMSGTIVTNDISADGGTIGGLRITSDALIGLKTGISGITGQGVNQFEISSSQVSGELFISSSEFKVTNTGNISASAGDIGGFNIDGKLSGGEGIGTITLRPGYDAGFLGFIEPHIRLGGKSSLTNNGSGLFVSPSGFSYGPNFKINPSGSVTASSALFNGTIDVTGTGTIANWKITENAIRSITPKPTAYPTGIEISSEKEKGIIGHGDFSSREFQTHDGEFKFTEDTISIGGGGGGIIYDLENQNIPTSFGDDDTAPDFIP